MIWSRDDALVNLFRYVSFHLNILSALYNFIVSFLYRINQSLNRIKKKPDPDPVCENNRVPSLNPVRTTLLSKP